MRTAIAMLAGLTLVGCDDGGGDSAPGEDAALVDAAMVDAAPDATVDPPEDLQSCRNAGTAGATARCLEPTQTPEYYVAQASLYFDTLDLTAPEDAIPDYHAQVARWEWPPWLLLTGYGRDDMINTGLALRELDPSTVPERDCRFFPEQPFARCYIVFDYDGKRCPIYEEFTFNDAGEMTFIEAWSDLPGFHPTDKSVDPWGDAPDFPRLANRVPGLGNADGTLDLESEWMLTASMDDAEVADFAQRAENWKVAWAMLLGMTDPNFFAIGCGWEVEE